MIEKGQAALCAARIAVAVFPALPAVVHSLRMKRRSSADIAAVWSLRRLPVRIAVECACKKWAMERVRCRTSFVGCFQTLRFPLFNRGAWKIFLRTFLSQRPFFSNLFWIPFEENLPLVFLFLEMRIYL